MANDRPSSLYRFGDFSLDVDGHRLSRQGDDVLLRPKPFATLVHLVERAGQLASKQELIDDVWQGAIVSENALTRCIKEIRKALEDDSRNPTYIGTVHGLGYRFLSGGLARRRICHQDLGLRDWNLLTRRSPLRQPLR